jgi:hypothetical protein
LIWGSLYARKFPPTATSKIDETGKCDRISIAKARAEDDSQGQMAMPTEGALLRTFSPSCYPEISI